MKTLLKLLLFITLIWSPQITNASHIAGGSWEYSCIGPNTYHVELTLYRDCSGATLGNTQSVTFSSPCGADINMILNLQANSGQMVDDICDLYADSTTCDTGTYFGLEEYIYEGTVVLNPPCNSWTMAWTSCCRNPAIQSIANPGSTGLYVETTMNTLADSCNSSPQFATDSLSQPVPFICQNELTTYSFDVFDPDGDSLVYSFAAPLSGAGIPVTWVPPASTNSQIPGITINSATGELSFTPTVLGSYVVTIQVCEYDPPTGVLLGCVTRDVQFNTVVCNGFAPTASNISNFTGDGVLSDSVTITSCPGDSFSFEILITDLDVVDSVEVSSNVTQVLPGSNVSFTGVNPVTMHVEWRVDPTISSVTPIAINFRDNGCIVPRSGSKTLVIILSPNTYAGPDVNICKGTEWTTLSPSGGTIFSWSLLSGSPIDTVPGSPTFNMTCTNCTSPQVSPQTTSTYIVTSNLSSTCKFMDTLTVNSVTNYNVSTGPDTMICSTGMVDSIDLYSTISVPGNYSYSWDNSQWISNDTISNPRTFSPFTKTYAVTVTSDSGCVKTASNTVIKLPPVPNLVIDADPENICQFGDSVDLFLELNPNFSNTCDNTLLPCGNAGYFAEIELDYNPADGTSGPIVTMGPNSFPAPFGNSYKSTKQQFLYRANELHAMGIGQGLIMQLGFFVTSINGTANYYDYSLKMGCTSYQSVPGTQFIFAPMAEVFPAQNVNLTLGWNMLEFSTPYIWDGVSNIVVEICYDMRNSNATQNSICRTREYKATTPGGQIKFNNLPYGVDTLKACNLSIAVFPWATTELRPDTRFKFCSGYDSASYTYEWYPNMFISDTTIQNPTVWPDSTTTYNVILADTHGVCVDTTSIEISVMNFEVGSDTLICSGDTIQLFPSIFDNCNTFNPIVIWYPRGTAGQVISSGLNPTVSADSTTVFVCEYTNFCGCSVIDSMTVFVNQLEEPILTFTGPTCGLSDGEIMVQNNGGVSPFTYSNDGGLTYQIDSVFTNLPKATYVTQYMDNNGCISLSSFDTLINQYNPLIDSVITNTPLCFATATGQIDVYYTGGTPPVSISVDGGLTWGTNNPVTNQLAGTYVVYVQDVNSCISYPDTVTIASNVELLFDSLQFSNVTCFQDSTGTINAFGHGGTPPYTYSIDSGFTYQSSFMFNTLKADTYHVVIMDSVGCTTIPYQQIIEDGPEILPTFTIQNDTCYNACGGSNSVAVAGGTSPFTYSWRKGTNIIGLNSSSVSGLCEGTDYELSIIDVNGCSKFAPFTITHPDEIVASATSTNITCFGANNGTISISSTGGIPPFRYSIDNGSTFSLNPNFNGLAAGNYSIVVADSAMRCTGNTTAVVIEPNQIELTTNITTAQVCVSGCIQLSANATGGTGGPYSYIWNQGFDSSATQLACPTQTTLYSVYAVDSAGCTSAPKVITLTLYDSIVANAGENIDICPGESTPLNPSATGGLNNIYNYQWTPVFGLDNGFAKNPIAKPATSTLYTVKITDNCATPASYDSVWVNVHPNPTMDFFTNDSVNGCEPFNIRLTNNSTPVQFSEWTITSKDHEFKTHGNQVDLTDLQKGIYDVSLHVVTPQGCFGDITKTEFFEVYPLPTALFSMDPDPTTIYNTLIQFEDQSIGEVQAWQWDFASIGASNEQNPRYQLPADSGTFPITLLVTTDKLCEDEVTELLRIGGEYNMYIPNSFTPNGDGKNDVFAPRGLGVDPDGYSLIIYDRWGGVIFESNNLGQPWDGRHQGSTKMAPNGVYIWKIVAKDGTDDSKTHEYSGTINLLR